MKEKSRKYSFAASMIFLIMGFTQLYGIVYATLYGARDLKMSYWKYTEKLFKADRWGLLLSYMIPAVILVLCLALLVQSRALFLFACMVNIGVFVIRTIDWAKAVKDIDGFWKLDAVGYAFAVGVVIPGLVVLFLLLMAISLLALSNATKAFGYFAVFFTSFTFGIAAFQDIYYITQSRSGKTYKLIKEFRSRMNTFNAGEVVSPENVFYMLVVVCCIVSWATALLKSKTEAENKQPGIVPPNPGTPVTAPFVPTPANPYPGNAATNFKQPVTPVAPAAPVTPVAPAVPVTPVAPAAPAAAVKPAEAPKPASVAATAAEIDDAYEKIIAEAGKSGETVLKAEDSITKAADSVKETVSEAVSEAEETVAAAEEYVPEQYSDDVASILGKYADDAEEAVSEAAGEAEDFAEELAADAADAVADAAADAIEKNE